MILMYFFICYSFVFSAINLLNQNREFSTIHKDVIYLPEFDISGEKLNDRRFQYGHKFNTSYNISNSGTWEITENGDLIWRLGIKSEDAYALKLQIDIERFPEDSYFFLYNDSKEMVYGPYTNNDFKYNSFGSPLIKGDLIFIEYYQPSYVSDIVDFEISSVIHDYTDIFNFYNNSRERDCGENVACETAQEYRDQSNSVIYMLINQYTCTGSLINNVNNDNTPYVLTAWHCIVGETSLGDHNDFVYYFNHESSTCNGSNGSFEYSVSGSTLLATRNENVGSDFALLVMDESPPEEWNPFYAGWSNDEEAPLISVGIHHPEDYPRKINYDDDYATSCAWNTANTHWCLTWDDGGTADGSSGSPLFNFDKQIIGTNTGSDGPDCSAGPDLYGKFSLSWDGGNNSTRRLKDWLDPNDTGVIAIDGIYTNSIYELGDMNSDGIINVLDLVAIVNIILGLDSFNNNGDINQDNVIDITDVISLLNIILGDR
tara:strand:- start:69 stop:1529 length:1461 start_codon:yes stop_codon:yes gene_type:complete